MPYSKLDSTDPDGRDYKSLSVNTTEPELLRDRSYFFNIYKYLPGIGVGGEDAPDNKGAVIKTIPAGQELELAGLKKDDVITRIGNTRVSSYRQLLNTLMLYSPGEAVEIEYKRGTESHTAKVTVYKIAG
jgi:serine protease Do